MEKMDELASTHIKIKDAIEALRRNFRKDSHDRKSKADYTEKREQQLDQEWQKFQIIHNELLEMEGHENHPYFKENFYDKVQQFCNNYQAEIKQTKLTASDLSTDGVSAEPTSADQVAKPTMTSKMFEIENKDGNRDEPAQHKKHEVNLPPLLRKQYQKANGFFGILHRIDNRQEAKTQAYLRQMIKMIEDYWTAITQIHDEIIMADELAGFDYTTNSVYSEWEGIYEEAVIQLQQQMYELTTNTAPASEIKLPALALPNFSGGPNSHKMWKTFHDLFESSIHANKSLSNAQKLQYLKANISGEAAKLISHLNITNENFKPAWQMITERYNNLRSLTSHHLDDLLSQPTLVAESSRQLRTFHDTTKECLHAIQNLGVITENWDTLLVHILLPKLDKESRRLFEHGLKNSREIQTISTLLKFLETRFNTLEAVEAAGTLNHSKTNSDPERMQRIKRYQVKQSAYSATVKRCCTLCDQAHHVERCAEFGKLEPIGRLAFTNKKNICNNCLESTHQVNKCKTGNKCTFCNGRHHSLLHITAAKPPATTANQNTTSSHHIINTLDQHPSNSVVLLGTAVINATSSYGKQEMLRILIDPGSQASFITEEAANKLKLKGRHVYAEITGMSEADAGIATKMVNFTIQPRFPSQFKMKLSALVVSKLTKRLPDAEISPWNWEHINNLLWADPNYNSPAPIDILLGADHYGDIILSEVAKGKKDEPIAQNSELGWVIYGRAAGRPRNNTIATFISTTEIDKSLQRFWELEDTPAERKMTEEEQACEDHYQRTHTRYPDGSYEVQIPFKEEMLAALGQSRKRALARFLQVERALKTNATKRQQYNEFLSEYVTLGHMKLLDEEERMKGTEVYYLPHHAVIKEQSTTTKLRVVFDASAKTTTGLSLNDTMYTGPTLQQDIVSILLRWRKHKFAYTADIEKMYRQVKLNEAHQNYHRILWRESTTEPIKEYKLTTLTYGTAAASYLAIRTLHQIAEDEKEAYPIASNIIENDFYVDDLLSGNDSLTEAQIAQDQLIKLLQRGGFNLRKWASNSQQLLDNLPSQSRNVEKLQIKIHDGIKTLGIYWSPEADTFEFVVKQLPIKPPITKRKVLSEASKLYDPLGWLAPIIVQAKIILQQLWQENIAWDQALPQQLENRWNTYYQQLPEISKIRIPRWINYTSTAETQLHGFCDASEAAYGACIYLRVSTNDADAKTMLVISKTKVAPIKTKLTLPRLELCGAELLSKLLRQVKNTMKMENCQSYAWCDSTITLAWINGNPNKFKTFVANRVSNIQRLSNKICWNHIISKDNPADYCSRGTTPAALKNNKMWWNGPQWLSLTSAEWPVTCYEPKPQADLELKRVFITTVEQSSPFSLLFERISSFAKIQRVTAYCLKFISACRPSKSLANGSKQGSIGFITTAELRAALLHIIRNIQAEHYNKEIQNCKSNKSNKSSDILMLNPFLDKEGVLRVGGRIQHASVPFNQRHPMILPPRHSITKLIIEQAHRRTLHGGPQLTLTHIREKFWITSARNQVRSVIDRCVTCRRYKAQSQQQIMGNLPSVRVQPSRPFSKAGVDYAGPIQIRATKGRGHKSYKGYLAIFVCLSVKAIHIEVVSDQTTSAFIAAYKRFTARRGMCSDLYSDNGTNFVGANNELAKNLKQARQQWNRGIAESIAMNGTTWHFIPPNAPHFGGIWEAGVKSVKHHLRRIVGNATLTFEELTTLMSEIEACLNSRPLSPLSCEPNDFGILTPGHFLIGEALISPPEPNLEDQKTTSLSRWNMLQKLKQDFWKRWQNEYLCTLLKRPKWKIARENLHQDQLVVIKDDGLPPSKWSMGRIVETHPGKDGNIRVVSLRGPGKTILKRPITKIVPLLMENDGKEAKQKTKEIAADADSKAPEVLSRTRRTARACGTSRLAVLLTVVLCLGVQGIDVKNAVDLQPFNSPPGVFFEKIATAHFVNNHWHTIIYYNMTGYFAELKQLRLCVKQISAICQDTVNANLSSHTCEAFLNQLQDHLKGIEALDSLIAAGNNENHRQRRGLINGGGYLLNELFGVLDQRDAANIEEKIENLNSKGTHILELMRNQTTITEATVQMFKDHERAMLEHSKLYDRHLEELIKQSNTAHKEIAQLKIDDATVTLALHATLMMIKYQQTQHIIIDMITQTHHAKIHPLLFPPAKLIAEIQSIKAHSPRGASIAELEKGGLTNLYKLMGVKVRNTGKLIIFRITLPLPNTEAFQVFHLIPVPIIHGNEAFLIKPNETHLMVNAQRDRFYTSTEADLHKCLRPTKGMILCKPNHPIYTAKSSKSQCAIDLLNHAAEKPTSCLVEKLKLPIYKWTPLTHENNWIYVMSTEATVDVICEDAMSAMKLQGQGVLKLIPPCILKHEGTIITSLLNQYQVLVESFIPTTNFTLALQAQHPDIELLPLGTTINRTNQDWDRLETMLTNHKVEVDRLMNTKLGTGDWHNIQQHSLLYILVAVMAILIIASIIWCRRASAATQGQVILPMQSIRGGSRLSGAEFAVST